MNLRENWLTKAMQMIIEKVFQPHELAFPPIVKIGCAPLPWKTKITDEGPIESGTLGICVYPEQADDGCVHIFINTVLGSDDAMKILGTVVHELVHAHVMGQGYECKHGHPFNKIIRTVGLEGKPKSTFVAEDSELYATLSFIASELGEYPHKPLRPKQAKTKQSNMVTWVSITDPEYELKSKFQVTYEKGVPKDYNGQQMEPKDKGKFAEMEERFLAGLTEDEEAEQAEEKEAAE